ncbi:MAG: hypothetical protein GY757_04870 [bacterium]|nr:hypothetical protein [bacterium]
MCHFITIILPPKADEAAAREIANRYRRDLEPLTDNHVQPYLAPGEHYFSTTRGHCDCGTALGSRSICENGDRDFSSDIKKFRKKGWSENKIQRWLDQMKQIETRDARVKETLHGRKNADAGDWLELLGSVIRSKACQRIGLLFYWSTARGSKIAPQDRIRVKVARADENYLFHLKENQVYEFY